jgi:hypothetical protein
MPTSAAAPNTAPLPPTNTPTINNNYNASQAVISFLIIVKPAFTKYLEKKPECLNKAYYIGKI